MRGLTMMLAAMALAVPVAVVAKMTVSPAITKALADPARADQAGDDARRHAAEVIAFAGVKPGQTVVDFLPGKGYWTRIFTGVVGPSGHVYALWPNVAIKSYQGDIDALTARHLTNVTAEGQATNLPTVAKPVDLFWTVQNYHDLNNFARRSGVRRVQQGGVRRAEAGRHLSDRRSCRARRERPCRHRHAAPDRPGDRQEAGARGGVPVGRGIERAGQSQGRPQPQGIRPGDPRRDRPVRL